jgi:hypothetical protein
LVHRRRHSVVIANQIAGFLGVAGAVAATDYESIAIFTVGAGGSSSITFSSIAGTYSHLQIRWLGLNTDTADSGIGNVRTSGFFNSDTTQTNYYSHELRGNGALASAGAENSSKSMGNSTRNSMIAGAANIVDILDYSNTNKYKTVRTLSGLNNNDSNDAAQSIRLISGVWKNTAAITNIQLVPESGTFKQYSHFALYGIK